MLKSGKDKNILLPSPQSRLVAKRIYDPVKRNLCMEKNTPVMCSLINQLHKAQGHLFNGWWEEKRLDETGEDNGGGIQVYLV